MDESLRAKLNDAIRAIRAGDRAHGRELLVQIVEADERIEPAWLWLSETVDDPADKITALENALTINPKNAPVRAKLNALREQAGIARVEATPASPPPPGPSRSAPMGLPFGERESAANVETSPLSLKGTAADRAGGEGEIAAPSTTAVDPDDDPLQCPYCGQLTAEVETACPHCRRSLLALGRWSGKRFLYFLLITLGLNVQSSIFQGAIWVAVGVLIPDTAEWQARLAALGLEGGMATLPMPVLVVRFLLLLGVLILFLHDLPFAFSTGLVVMTLDLIAHGVGWWMGFVPPALLIWNGVLSGLVWLSCLLAETSKAASRARLYTQLDRSLHGAVEFYKRAREHQREGQWALAALHLQKALALKTAEPLFYKELALVQAKLGRYAKALATLEQGAFCAPDDPEFASLITEVRKRQKRAENS